MLQEFDRTNSEPSNGSRDVHTNTFRKTEHRSAGLPHLFLRAQHPRWLCGNLKHKTALDGRLPATLRMQVPTCTASDLHSPNSPNVLPIRLSLTIIISAFTKPIFLEIVHIKRTDACLQSRRTSWCPFLWTFTASTRTAVLTCSAQLQWHRKHNHTVPYPGGFR